MVQKYSFSELCFPAWKYLQQKPVIPALPLGELVQEINKDHLTQSEGMFSLALEVRKAGNDL